MSSLLRKDKIGALNESGGNILLGPSILTIGGRQYETTSQIQVALPSFNILLETRYVYAILNAGNVELVISSNVNSNGPTGASSWKLVGAFMVGQTGAGALEFGAFMDIDASPSTRLFHAGQMEFGTTGATPPTKSSIPTVDSVQLQRKGSSMRCIMSYRHTSQSGAISGTNNYTAILPGGKLIHPNVTLATLISSSFDSYADSPIGSFQGFSATTVQMTGSVVPVASNAVGAIHSSFASASTSAEIWPGTRFLGQATVGYTLDFEVSISDWLDTPLKDL